MPSKRIKKPKRNKDVKLNITSMMDMFTIILVFLLKSYSTEGVLVTPSNDLQLPQSQVQNRVTKASLEILVSSAHIVVAGKIVASVPEEMKSPEMTIPTLVSNLRDHHEKGKMMAEQMSEQFKDELVIQGDQKMPYKLLTKVMYSCGQAGYSQQKFVVYQNE